MTTSPVTFNDVRDAVHSALDHAFPDIAVMAEEEGRTPAPPCFIVRLTEPRHEQELGRRFRRSHPFRIRYYAAEQQDEALYDVAEQLTAALGQIELAGRPVRGTGMRFERHDEGLQFFVEYHFHVWAPPPNDPAMASLDVQEGLK